MHHPTDSERLAAIEASSTAMADDIAEIKKAIAGNGQPGLVQRLSALEIWQGQVVGSYHTIIRIGGIVSVAGGLISGAWVWLSKVLKHA